MAGYKHPCRYCNALTSSDAVHCPSCGKMNPTGPLRCPRCRSPVRKRDVCCGHCGLNLHITCFHCQETTFFAHYCDACGEKLTVLCSNPKCRLEQPPVDGKCGKCGKPLESSSSAPAE